MKANNHQLKIPVNWQDDFFDKVDFSYVTEAYGKLHRDDLGGGRSSFASPHTNKKKVESFVNELHKRDVKFNYLINATCLGNMEVTRSGHKKIRKLLDWLSSINVDIITVANPLLLDLIKEHYPNFITSISTQARVDCLERVNFWKERGADQISLSYVDLNRNFTELKRIMTNSDLEFDLIANLICRNRCNLVELHGNFNAHASQKNNKGAPIDHYCIFCAERIFSNPAEIIRSTWIRPEDIDFYREIGITKFKLVDRAMTTDALKTVVDAYSAKRYEGNFIDLIPSMGKLIHTVKTNYGDVFKYFFRPMQLNLFKLGKLVNVFNDMQSSKDYGNDLGIYIDNRKMDGLIEFFYKNNCPTKSCKTCKCCDQFAEKNVRYLMEKEQHANFIENIGTVRKELVNKRFYKYGK